MKEILSKRIKDMEWSVRTTGALTRNFHTDVFTGKFIEGVEPLVTLGDLVKTTEAELLRVPNFGRKSLNEVRASLHDLGLHLGMEIPAIEKDANTLRQVLIRIAKVGEARKYPVSLELIQFGVRIHMFRGERETSWVCSWEQMEQLRIASVEAVFEHLETNLDEPR